MTQRRKIELSGQARQELVELRDGTKEEYVRERCAAILKIADGASAHQVAKEGLLRPRDPDTVYSWLASYENEGIAGLKGHKQGGKRRGYL
jgi:transposase